MPKRINGWLRTGVVLSILWVIGAGLYTHNGDVKAANQFAELSYKVCTNEKLLANDTNLLSCEQGRQINVAKWLKDGNSQGNVAFWALVPIPFGWLTAFILIYVIRVQVIGFRTVIPWRSLSLRKKSFVVFCVLATLVFTFGCIVTLMNLYVDTQIPVALSPFKDVTKTGDDFVTVVGTWIRTDLTGDTISNPLQTSRIECNKQEHKCVEAKAFVSGNLLTSDIEKYDIRSWTADAVIFVDEEECTTTVFTIDLNTKTVSGAGHLINQDNISCKMNFKSKETWSFLLTNGFNVYWEQRKNARPALLKVVQAAFGN